MHFRVYILCSGFCVLFSSKLLLEVIGRNLHLKANSLCLWFDKKHGRNRTFTFTSCQISRRPISRVLHVNNCSAICNYFISTLQSRIAEKNFKRIFDFFTRNFSKPNPNSSKFANEQSL